MKTREPLQVMQLARIGLVEYRNMALTSRKHADLPSPASPAAKPIKSDVKVKTSVSAGSTTALTAAASTAPAMGLPCQMDHMYANSNNFSQKQISTNMPNGKSDTSEVDHLKALVLLHLDLAQHQAELLAAKDKEIARLKEENQTLKQRLERSERRISASALCKNEALSTNPSTSSTPVPISVETSGLSTSIPSAPTSSSATEEEILSVDDKPEVDAFNPVAAKYTNNAVPLEGATSGTSGPERHPPLRSKSKKQKLSAESATHHVENDGAQNTTNEESRVGSESHSMPKSAPLPSKVLRKSSGDPTSRSPLKRRRLHSPPERHTKTEPSEAQLKAESPPPSSTSLNPEHVRIQRLLAEKGPPKEANSLKVDSILTTETPYFTLVGEQHDSDVEDVVVDTSEIEVPRWLIKPVPSLYSIEGTENLDDEIFLKRHLKHESDEKRRKRWDLQRIREQRQYEKLRARYEGEDRCQERGIDNRDLRNQDCLGNLSTLWHDPDNASALQVEAWLPVTAFGAPLPALQPSEFSLPWVSSTSTRSKAVSESFRKRHRR